MPTTSNARTPAAKSRYAIAMPSIVTRSNGGWSRSATTSSANTRPTQSARAPRGARAASARWRGSRLRLRRLLSYGSSRLVDPGFAATVPVVAAGTILNREEASMARVLISGFAICLVAGTGWAQVNTVDTQKQADSRTVLGVGNEILAAGAEMIRAGQYDRRHPSDDAGSRTPGVDRTIEPRLCRISAPRMPRAVTPISRSPFARSPFRSTRRTGARTATARTRIT